MRKLTPGAEMLAVEKKVPSSACHSCGNVMDGCSGVGTPEPGDITICIRCSGLNIFDGGMRLREPTDAELKEVAGNPDLITLTNIVAEVREDEKRAPWPR